MTTTLFITLRCLRPLLAIANISSPAEALRLQQEAQAPNPAVGLAQPSPVLHSHLPSFISLPLTFPSVPFHSEEHQRACRCSSCCFIPTCCSPPCHPLSVSGRPPYTFKTQHVPPPTIAIQSGTKDFPGLLLHGMNFCVHGHSSEWNSSLIKGSVPINWECLRFKNRFIFCSQHLAQCLAHN